MSNIIPTTALVNALKAAKDFDEVSKILNALSNTEQVLQNCKRIQEEAQQAADMVNHPPHYTDGKIEVIDFIEDKKLPYHLGNVVKYVARAGKKGNVLEDLKKAKWYLERYIDRQTEWEKLNAKG